MIGDRLFKYRVTFVIEYTGALSDVVKMVENSSSPICKYTLKVKEIEKRKIKYLRV